MNQKSKSKPEIIITPDKRSLQQLISVEKRSALKIAEDSLQANILLTQSGPYITAGQNQYKTIWTRDFCYSVRGLLQMGREDIVKNQLQVLISFAREKDGLVPRVIDSVPVQIRVLWNSIRGVLTKRIPNFKFNEPLLPQYMDEHFSPAMDSNILVILGVVRYLKLTNDELFWKKNEKSLNHILKFYENKFENGLIKQSKFSDWQDSVRRDDKTFYLNHLYWWACNELESLGLLNIKKSFVENLKNILCQTFYSKHDGIFYSIINHRYYSLDGNLMALESGLLNRIESENLYKNLKKSALWKGSPNQIPGFNTIPRYPSEWHHIPVKLAGLTGYHDHIYWSWLMGYATAISKKMKDITEYQILRVNLENILIRDQVVSEIYHPHNLLPWSSHIYRSEAPFSWGASFILDALG